MKILLGTGLLFLLLSCGPSPLAEEEAVFNADSLKSYAATVLGDSSGWIMLSQPGICWHCNGYYYYLGKEIHNRSDARLVLLTQKFRPAAKKEMYDGLGWNFSDRIRHQENADLYLGLKRHAGKRGWLIGYHSKEVTVYPIEDRDKMKEQWPEIKATIGKTER